jgi:hypothetical protein
MTISEHAEVFHGRKVKEFEGEDDWEGPGFAYRVGMGWDDPAGQMEVRLDELIACEGAKELEALVIGPWHSSDDFQASSEFVIKLLVDRRKKLPALKALFLGDITYEENEISWIQQSNVSPLLDAFPKLEVFRVRGGTQLEFAPVQHKSLTHLIVETGGLPRSVIREICQCKFPKLQHLELWLGVENYGFDGGVEDLQPLLTGKLFAKLSYLGLRNSDIVDEIAAVVVNAPILQRIRVLDLSNGTLSDTGAQALLNLSPDPPLEELNLSHHYMTEKMVKQLRKTLKYRVITDEGRDPNEEWRSVVVSE